MESLTQICRSHFLAAFVPENKTPSEAENKVNVVNVDVIKCEWASIKVTLSSILAMGKVTRECGRVTQWSGRVTRVSDFTV